MLFWYDGPEPKRRAAGYVFKRGVARDIPDKNADALRLLLAQHGIEPVQVPAEAVAAVETVDDVTADPDAPLYRPRRRYGRKAED